MAGYKTSGDIPYEHGYAHVHLSERVSIHVNGLAAGISGNDNECTSVRISTCRKVDIKVTDDMTLAYICGNSIPEVDGDEIKVELVIFEEIGWGSLDSLFLGCIQNDCHSPLPHATA